MLTIIGVLVGVIMGLTGAGGALIAIPLLMQFQNMTLKEASVYSLITVVVAALSNFFFQRKDADIRLALHLVIAAVFGSLLSYSFKENLPNIAIASIITVVSLYSLYSVWIPRKPALAEQQAKSSSVLTILIGIMLGSLTTFTGLGGGVLVLPILVNIYHFRPKQAVATSLIVVGLSALASFLIQATTMEQLSLDSGLFGLIAGVLIASFALKTVLLRLPLELIDLIRKFVFSFVVFVALLKIFK